MKNDEKWNKLILSTGYTKDISDLSAYQLAYLQKIKTNFSKIEDMAYSEAQKILNEFYGDDNPLHEIDLKGLNLPEDDTNVWELYFESIGDGKYLIPIVIFTEFEITGRTYVN